MELEIQVALMDSSHQNVVASRDPAPPGKSLSTISLISNMALKIKCAVQRSVDAGYFIFFNIK